MISSGVTVKSGMSCSSGPKTPCTTPFGPWWMPPYGIPSDSCHSMSSAMAPSTEGTSPRAKAS